MTMSGSNIDITKVDRIPPHSAEAEIGVPASCLFDDLMTLRNHE
jgi:hypothetical protein